MWKRLLLLSLGLLGLSLASLSAQNGEGPLTETEIRAWAGPREKPEIVGALVTVVLNLEKLNLLYERERSDWMSTETELRGEIENARASLKKAESSFVVALREKDLKVTRARREVFIWKLISGAFVSGIVYIAVMR